MDDFLETVVARKKQGAYTLLYMVCWVFLVLFGLIAAFSLANIISADQQTGSISFSWQALLMTLAFGGAAFLLWRHKDACRLEYDYTFTNGTLDVSRVYNNRRRRYLTALEMKDVIRCGPAAGPAFAKTLNEPDIKRHNWFLNREANLYFFYFVKKGQKHVIILELHQEMIEMIRSSKRNYLPRDAWYDKDGKQTYGRSIS